MSFIIKLHPESDLTTGQVQTIIDQFNNKGELIGDGKRNVIKIIEVEGIKYNVKSFKIPNIFNKIAYKFLRKGKAERSFEYASKLKTMDILTPDPQAYVIEESFLFRRSFYISKQLDYDFTIRKMVDDPNCDEFENVVRAFTRFTFNLHEKGIHFIDHSPGNTLIKKNGEHYLFYLVDLNRMNFGTLDFSTRIKNFARLSAPDKMLEVMSDEYSKLINQPKAEVFKLMKHYADTFRNKLLRKKRLKKRLKI
ncbi:Kdo domain containing protein [Paucihalobacter ruber]|uniref:Kdo domain containing protein n=1 Tax=Paucihalobacter ruber TaxID=2567861 RepID=A0A506PG67_9FLAO|nr:Kdo domain containing protein [Paucihalobacter ruber]TPV32861.1 Kdo domain containing protein [Paucihalobacter ruber]